MVMRDNQLWKWYHSAGLVGLVVFVCLLNWLVNEVRTSWLLTLGALTAFTMVVSDGITGRFWQGWLINEQYRVSLSRLQVFLWTVIIFSCFATAVSINIKAGLGIGALEIAIQKELWIAMGISATSLVGSPLILTGKKRKSRYAGLSDSAEETERDKRTARRMRVLLAERLRGAGSLAEQPKNETDLVDRRAEGVVYHNEELQEACLSDLFRGEELSNFDVVDIARLQAFFFTVVLVVTYGINAVAYLAKADQVTELPTLGASGLSLLAMSTGIYLTGKAVPKGH
jgi:hypothetical protein